MSSPILLSLVVLVGVAEILTMRLIYNELRKDYEKIAAAKWLLPILLGLNALVACLFLPLALFIFAGPERLPLSTLRTIMASVFAVILIGIWASIVHKVYARSKINAPVAVFRGYNNISALLIVIFVAQGILCTAQFFLVPDVAGLLELLVGLSGFSMAIHHIIENRLSTMVTEQYIYFAGQILPWEHIESYHWIHDQDGTYRLRLRLRGRAPLLRTRVVRVPTLEKTVVEDLVERKVAA
jgi:hypothetical protein